MKLILYIITLSIIAISCDKINVPKYSGRYIGQSDVYSWNMNDGVTSDTVYTDTLEVISDGDYLLIYWQKKTHIDSIQEGLTYSENIGSDGYSVKFYKDSIYFNSHGGGQGGGSSRKFKGQK